MSDPAKPGNRRPQDDQPTTEEALPGVDLGPEGGSEEVADATIGPTAAERAVREAEGRPAES